ncbi:MAG: PAS domain S-box protein [Sphingobacteriales bacterium]|nr:MAG: PAS domain S-box protein [Sphingobacteriales bacterium]
MMQYKRPSEDTLKALETAPAMFLILAPDLYILTASNLFLEATGTDRAAIAGKYFFDAFPGNPDLLDSNGVANILSSINEVMLTGKQHAMPIQRYHVPDRSAPGTLIIRYWEPLHIPVFDEKGLLSYIIQSVKNVTEEVMSKVEARQSKLDSDDSLRELGLMNRRLELEVARRTAELKQSESKYRNLIQHCPVAIQVFRGEDMVFEIVNDLMLGFLGKTRDIIGKTLFEGVPEIVGQPIVDVLYGVYKTGEPLAVYGEKVILERNGKSEIGYYDVIYRALYDDEKITGVLGIAIDVTPQIVAQQAIVESEERFRNMAENSDILISLVDEFGTLEYLNASWAKMTGWVRDNLKQLSWDEYVHPDDRSAVTDKFINGLENKTEFVNEFRLQNKENDYRWLRIKGTPRFDSLQSFRGFIFSGIDITEEKQRLLEIEYINKALIFSNEQLLNANLKLLESEENLLTAFDAGELGSCSLDLKTGKAEMSERYRHLYGLPQEVEISWEMVLQAVEPEFLEEVNLVLENAIKFGKPVDSTYAIRHLSTGEKRWMRVVGKVYQGIDGTNERVYAIVMDVTAQKQDELRKNDFIAMVSHELKTPLTSINGYVQLLGMKMQNGDNYDGSPILTKIHAQLKKMTTMINGFLSISRLESGKIHLIKKTLNFSEIIGALVEEYKMLASTHNFIFNKCGQTMVNADEDKIEHVLNNLLSNAVKYSPANTEIEIDCRVDGDIVMLSVKDRGMGIHVHDIPKLFERYYRVQSLQTSTIAGFGIGLYLCAEIIERHGGKIWVESELDLGSIFYFSLPLITD